jgi:hypothetical protein
MVAGKDQCRRDFTLTKIAKVACCHSSIGRFPYIMPGAIDFNADSHQF